MKKLYRSKENKTVSGLFGGLGEYFSIDPIVLRVVFIFIMFTTAIFPAVISYFVAVLIVPKKN